MSAKMSWQAAQQGGVKLVGCKLGYVDTHGVFVGALPSVMHVGA